MADRNTLIALLGDYDNSGEPTPNWNHKELIVGLTIGFLVSLEKSILCGPEMF